MLSKFTNAGIYQLSVGNVLQNILFYGLLVLMALILAWQLSHKKAFARKRSIAK